MLRRAWIALAVFLAGCTSAQAQIDCAPPQPASCRLLDGAKAIFVGTVTEANEKSLIRRFRVTEPFKGVHEHSIDISEIPGSFDLKVGEQYLVFASSCPWNGAGPGCLAEMPCSRTRKLADAAAILEELRSEKNGKRVAAVYGTLTRTLEANQGIWEENYRSSLPHITLRLGAAGKSFATKTDDRGAYAFESIPPGTYQVSAELPPDLMLGEMIGSGSPAPFELPRRTCFEMDLYALPTGRISGEVISPDGKPLPTAVVYLYRASWYKNAKPGLFSFQGQDNPSKEWKAFEFYHLPADDYVLVFNPKDEEDPDAPYRTTFFPQATSFGTARLIHLADGEQISSADIHVSDPLPTRQVSVRLIWGDRSSHDFYSPQVIVKASRGVVPYPYEAGRDTYSLNLLLNSSYTIRAEAFCRMGTTGKAETGNVSVDGSNLSVTEVTLKFVVGECLQK
jgi:hypothetical protein